jgi:ArsR family transcriptional regulator
MNATGELPLAPVPCCAPIVGREMSEGDVQATVAVFKALADRHRVRIVNLLSNSDVPVCACDVQASIGVSQATTSFHLKKLTAVGLVDREQRGTWGYYQINPRVLARLRGIFEVGEAVR